jgi:hypothetical protein
MKFAPGLVGTFQDSEGGTGSHCPVPLHYRPLPMSRSIGEPLADNPAQCLVGAFGVVYAERDSAVVSKIKLGEVTMQVFLADMLVNAIDAALEDREVSLGGIGRRIAANVFLLRVIDGAVTGKALASLPVDAALIGPQVRGNVDFGFKNGSQIHGSHFRDMMGTDAPFAFYQSNDSFLGGGCLVGAVPGSTANESLVSFDELSFAAERAKVTDIEIRHCLTDAVRQEPCGLQGDAEDAVQLVAAHSFLAGAEQVHCLQPHVQLYMAGLEDGPDFDGERLPTGVALVDADPGALAFERPAFVDDAAMWAWPTIRPQPPLNEAVGGFFTVEMCGGKDGRHGASP